jgi:hypothetical protein
MSGGDVVVFYPHRCARPIAFDRRALGFRDPGLNVVHPGRTRYADLDALNLLANWSASTYPRPACT